MPGVGHLNIAKRCNTVGVLSSSSTIASGRIRASLPERRIGPTSTICRYSRQPEFRRGRRGITPVGLRRLCVTPRQRHTTISTGRGSTYRGRNTVSTKPATSQRQLGCWHLCHRHLLRYSYYRSYLPSGLYLGFLPGPRASLSRPSRHGADRVRRVRTSPESGVKDSVSLRGGFSRPSYPTMDGAAPASGMIGARLFGGPRLGGRAGQYASPSKPESLEF
jgi:hypothetical protein